MPVTALLSGVFIPHQPVRSPGHHVRLSLRDHPQTARTRVLFDRTPGRNMPDMPAAVKSLFVGVVTIPEGPGDS